ncbi:protein PYRICULARIA ORYZAE RESISTANCE 21-like isoform X5 [Alnus glutinosa]|nr:protein PYRICULARIA ORYZAE RESISTANCE 21-like isoform X5 [Alnus glutinosa]
MMVLKVVDLQCCRCYKKVKKVLCKFPQVQDQIYDEKQNKVTIKVVSSCPEKIMQKIRCKGGKCIMCIEIKPPPPPPPGPKLSTPPAQKRDKTPPRPPPPPCKVPVFIPVCLPPYPIDVRCKPCPGQPLPCSCGCGGSRGCNVSRQPLPCSCGCGGSRGCNVSRPGQPLPCSCGCGGSRGCYVSRCDYFCEENPSECRVM